MKTDSRATRVRRHAVHALLGAVLCAVPLAAQQGPKPKPGAQQDSINAAQQAQIDSLRNALGTVNIRLLTLFAADSLTNVRIDTLHAVPPPPPPPDTTSSGVVELSRTPTDVTYEATWPDYAPSQSLVYDDGVSKVFITPALSPERFSYPRRCSGPRDVTVTIEGWENDTIPRAPSYGYDSLGVVTVPARDPADCSSPPPPPPPDSAHPNEPVGFTPIIDTPWDVVPKVGWGDADASTDFWKANPPVSDFAIVSDPTAPLTPESVLQAQQFAGEGNGGTQWQVWNALRINGRNVYRKIYVDFRLKLEDVWLNHPVGAKFAFITPPSSGAFNGSNSVYLGFDNNGNSGSTPDIDQANIQINLQGQPWGNRNLYPNVDRNAANLGTDSSFGDRRNQWIRVEVLLEMNTTGNPANGLGANGVARIWVDGVLVSDYTDVMYQDQTVDDWVWNVVQIIMVYGGGPGAAVTDQWMQFDHIYASGSN